jgi:hypothetical protein
MCLRVCRIGAQVISRESAEADKVKQVVSKEEAVASAEAATVKAIKDECEADLSKAMPLIEAAEKVRQCARAARRGVCARAACGWPWGSVRVDVWEGPAQGLLSGAALGPAAHLTDA